MSPVASSSPRGSVRRFGIAALVTAVTLVGAAIAPLHAAATAPITAGDTITFSATGAEQTFVVPAGATEMHVTLVGAPGSGTYPTLPDPKPGGKGAVVRADIPAPTPGTTVYVEVGGPGTFGGNAIGIGGFNGGGNSGGVGNGAGAGGGATDLRTVSNTTPGTLTSRLAVAGGGGGAGEIGSDINNSCYYRYNFDLCPAGPGGSAVTNSWNGGAGGTAPINGAYYGSYNANGGVGGGGGTQLVGGAGGPVVPCGPPAATCYQSGGSPGNNGTLGVGGDGSAYQCWSFAQGGGGGGGYYGGGGGAGGNGACGIGPYETPGSGGGGAGSSWVEPSALTSSVVADASGTPTVSITFNPTTTAVSCVPSPVAVGDASTCTASVSNVDVTDAVAASGTVNWTRTAGSGSLGSSSCVLGVTGTCSVTYTPDAGAEGNHTLNASYLGDTDHSPSSGSGNLTAGKRMTSAVMNCTPTSTPVNLPATCVTSVTDTSAGTGSIPGGTITWSSGFGSFSPLTCTLSAGACSSNFTPSPGHVGVLATSVSYSGDSDHASSTGPSSVTATQRATALSAACVPLSDVVNAAATCTATPSDATDPPTAMTRTGSVSWSINSGSGNLSSASCVLASGSCSVAYTPALGSEGSHSLQATYNGDTNYAGSTQAASVTAVVRASSVASSCAPSPDSVNAVTTCTTTVTDASSGVSSTPTGSVAWTVTAGSGALGAPSCALSGGSCSVTYTPSVGSEGSHTLHTVYSGDVDHSGSNADAAVAVGLRASTVTVGCAATSAPIGSSVTCVATVADASSGTATQPSGTVQWGLASGHGSFSGPTCALLFGFCFITYTPDPGTAQADQVRAVYQGDTDHATSFNHFNFTVLKRTTASAPSCVPTTLAVNAPTTCTVTVTDTDAGPGITPSASVAWSVTTGAGAFSTPTCALAAGTCSVTFTPAPASEGVQSIHAAYGGDANHLASAGDAPLTATVRTFTMTATCVPTIIAVHASGVCSTTLTDTAAGTPLAPSGTATWTITSGSGSFSSGTCVLVSGACSVSYAPALGSEGPQGLRVSYPGDADHAAAIAAVPIAATTRATATNAACVPSSDPVNATTTCSVTVSDTAPGSSSTPTGTVAWSVSAGAGQLSSPTCALVLAACSVTYTPASGSAGAHALTATYPSDADHASSYAAVPVAALLRTTAISAGCTTSTTPVNTSVSCVATVTDTATGTSSTPTGGVLWGTVSGHGSFSPPTCALFIGFCFTTFTPDPGSAGTDHLTATYNGDVDHATSAAQYAFTVVTRGTSTGASCVPTSTSVSAPTTCTATVTDTSPGTALSPSGSVAWAVGTGAGAFSASSCTLASGTCSVTFTPATGSEGAQSVHAAYTADVDHATSSNDAALIATQRSLTMAASCVPSSDAVNAATLCTATTTDTAAGTPLVPVGSVAWSITTGSGAFTLPTCTLVAGTCSVSYTPSPGSAGAHALLATWAGDTDHAGSTATAALTVTKRSASVVTSCTPASLVVHGVTACTATVSDTASGTSTTPTGSVAWSATGGSGSFVNPTCTLVGGACTATYTPASGSAGAQTVHATYSGDTDHSVSAATTPVTVVIRTSATVATCQTSTGPVTVGVLCTATATDTSGGAALVPAGSVSWSIASGAGSLSNPSCTLVSGSCSVTYTPVVGSTGPQTVQAHYNGDIDHSTSSATFRYTVTTTPVVIDSHGAIHGSGGATPDTAGAPTWPGLAIARGVLILPGETGGYTLDGYGVVHQWGTATAVATTATWPGWDIARAVAFNPCDPTQKSGYVLDGFGGIHPFGGAPAVTTSGYWSGWDIAKGFAFNPCSGSTVSGYVLDGYGGLHSFSNGGATPSPASAYWSGWNIARSVVVSSNGQGYTLDGYGGLHPFGGAPTLGPAPAYFGWDIARAMVLLPGAAGGYVLDGYGGLHAFGTAPAVSSAGYTPGQDVARGVAAG